MSLCFITYVPFVAIIIIYSKGITYLYSRNPKNSAHDENNLLMLRVTI